MYHAAARKALLPRSGWALEQWHAEVLVLLLGHLEAQLPVPRMEIFSGM